MVSLSLTLKLSCRNPPYVVWPQPDCGLLALEREDGLVVETGGEDRLGLADELVELVMLDALARQHLEAGLVVLVLEVGVVVAQRGVTLRADVPVHLAQIRVLVEGLVVV